MGLGVYLLLGSTERYFLGLDLTQRFCLRSDRFLPRFRQFFLLRWEFFWGNELAAQFIVLGGDLLQEFYHLFLEGVEFGA